MSDISARFIDLVRQDQFFLRFKLREEFEFDKNLLVYLCCKNHRSHFKHTFMLFARSYRLTSSASADAIRKAILGDMFRVHNLDFEVYESDNCIKIIPHTENQSDIKTLPITHIDLRDTGNERSLRVSYKIRKIDQGGPYLLMIFCLFMLIGSIAFYIYKEQTLALVFLGIFLVFFGGFWAKMQSGYFDYVAQIKKYLKEKASAK